jgi:hypothetical protein
MSDSIPTNPYVENIVRLHTEGEQRAWYSFALDLTFMTSPHPQVDARFIRHEGVHRATINLAPEGSGLEVVRGLTALSHGFVWLMLQMASDNAVTIEYTPEAEHRALFHGGSRSVAARLTTLLEHFHRVESNIDKMWNTFAPLTELIATDLEEWLELGAWPIRDRRHLPPMVRDAFVTRRSDQIRASEYLYGAERNIFRTDLAQMWSSLDRIKDNRWRRLALDISLAPLRMTEHDDEVALYHPLDVIEAITSWIEAGAEAVAARVAIESDVIAVAGNDVYPDPDWASRESQQAKEAAQFFIGLVESAVVTDLMPQEAAVVHEARQLSLAMGELTRTVMKQDIHNLDPETCQTSDGLDRSDLAMALSLGLGSKAATTPRSFMVFSQTSADGPQVTLNERFHRTVALADPKQRTFGSQWWRQLPMLEMYRVCFKRGKSPVCPFRGWRVTGPRGAEAECGENCIIGRTMLTGFPCPRTHPASSAPSWAV